MPWLAAILMTFAYFLSIPVVLAVVWENGRFAAAFRPFSPGAAAKAARLRAHGAKKRIDKKKTEKGLSRLMLPLRTFSTVREIIPSVTFEYFRINARLGFDDAAFTAIFTSALLSAGHIAACRARISGGVSVVPDFNNPVFEGSACAVFTVRVKDAIRAAARAAPEEENTPITRFLKIVNRFQHARRAYPSSGDIMSASGK